MTLSPWTSDAYFTNAAQAATWLDVLHTQSIALRLFEDFPMTTGVVNYPKFTAGLTPGWQAEGEQKADSKPTTDEVTFTAKLVYVLTAIGKQTLEDSFPSAEEAITTHALRALAAEIDAKIFEGDGTGNTLTGFYNVGTLNSVNYATDLVTSISKALTEVESDGGEPNFIALHPVVRGLLREMVRNTEVANFVFDPTSGMPLSAWGVPFYSHRAFSTNLGTGSDESWILVGDSRGAAIGLRSQPEILTTEHAVIDGVSCFENNLVGIRAEQRVALGFFYPELFCTILGVPTS